MIRPTSDNHPPLFDHNGRFLRFVTPEFLELHQTHLDISRNRRGHAREARLKPTQFLDCRPSSRLGLAFQQSLDSGRCWALRGVAGSR
jgi:hypothetical protein